MAARAEREHPRVMSCIEQAEAIAAWPDERLLTPVVHVSKWSPAQHLAHICITNGQIARGLRRLLDDPDSIAVEGGLNAAGRLVLSLGRLPRGRGRAPANVQPPETLDRETIVRDLARNRSAFETLGARLGALQDSAYRFRHPALGELNGAEWLRFVRIHTEHHLTIVHDIDEQRGKGEG